MIYRVLLLLFVLLCSCNINEQSKQNDLENEKFNKMININQVLINIFTTYINEKEFLFSSNINPIYSAYLFKRENKIIVTFWAGTQFPNYIEDYNPNSKFSYYECSEIKNFKTVLILNNSDLFEYLIKFQEISSDDFNKFNMINSNVIYDGSWYPESYVLFKDNNSYSFKKCNRKVINFLGKDFIKYEEQFK